MSTTEDNISVMVIDDDDLIIDSMSVFLDDLGFRVSGYTSAEDAIDEIRTNPPDVCIVDLRMGDINGEDVIKEILAVNAAVRCLFFTGSGYNVPEEFNAFGITQDDVIEKPVYDFDQLALKITNIRRKSLS